MFANCQMGGVGFSMPDVCKTPAPPAPFVPIPYPNIATGMTAIPTCPNILLCAMPAHNLMTTTPLSNGNNAGVMGGLVSQVFMGPARHVFGSIGVLYTGMPATKLTSPTAQNGMAMNMVGMTIAPAQVKILLLK